MKIEWVIVAEGFGANGSGAITAIGVDQVLIVSPSLPISTKRAVMVHLVADDDSLADSELSLAVKILAPSGRVLAAQTAPAKTGTPLWPDIPVTFNIFTEFQLVLQEFGTYTVDVEVTLAGKGSVDSKTSFYVCEPPVKH